jgi:hypothetical protein
MRDHVGNVGELLLEVALVGIQPLEQLVTARELPRKSIRAPRPPQPW